jgi:hypothetical protein
VAPRDLFSRVSEPAIRDKCELLGCCEARARRLAESSGSKHPTDTALAAPDGARDLSLETARPVEREDFISHLVIDFHPES